MKMPNKPIIYYIIILLFDISLGAEINHQYSLTNTTIARAKAMGGAFTAVEDGPASMVFNPATLVHFRYPRSSGFSFILSPPGAVAIGHTKSRLSMEGKTKRNHWAGGAGLVLKSLIYSNQSLIIGLNLTESLPYNPYLASTDDPAAADGVLDWNYDILTVTLKLAEQISIGVSGFYVKSRAGSRVTHDFASSYGIYMKPGKKFSVGISFFDYPARVTSYLAAKNRALDESINIGASYRPFSPLLFSLDVRNVSEDGQVPNESVIDKKMKVSKEIHAGIEFAAFSAFAIRAGYYRLNESNENIYTVGFGLLDANIFRKLDKKLAYRDYVLNYALEVDEAELSTKLVHSLTFLIRL